MTTRKQYEAEFRAMSEAEFTEAMANFLLWPDQQERCMAALSIAVERMTGKTMQEHYDLFESLNPTVSTAQKMLTAFGMDPSVPLVDEQGDWGYDTGKSSYIRIGGHEFQSTPTSNVPLANVIRAAGCLSGADSSAVKDFAFDVAGRVISEIRGRRLAEFNYILEVKKNSWDWRCLITPNGLTLPGLPRHHILVTPAGGQLAKVSNYNPRIKIHDVLPIWDNAEVLLSVDCLASDKTIYTFQNSSTNTYTKLLVGPTGRILATRKAPIH